MPHRPTLWQSFLHVFGKSQANAVCTPQSQSSSSQRRQLGLLPSTELKAAMFDLSCLSAEQPINRDELRQRLIKMTDAALREFGEAARYICSPAATLGKLLHGQDKMIHAHIARLAVLYKDLRIEVHEIVEPSVPLLDATDERYCKNYFLRRCIATLVEFAETVRLLDECDVFKPIKKGLDKKIRPYWSGAVRFFRQHEPFLKKVRNDIGGHFGSMAADCAVRHVGPEALENWSAELTER